MIAYTLDTNIISYILKGNETLTSRLTEELKKGNKIIINTVTYYEICRGMLSIDSHNKLSQFKKICISLGIAEFSRNILDKAAEIYATLRKNGIIIDDADIFIAAICIENGLVLVTNNEKHFENINGLEIENWCK